jgi:hypothetical protein
MNLHALNQMPELIKTFDIQRFFIQVIGIRGNSAQESSNDLQINHDNWVKHVPSIAEKIALQGIPVTYPKVFLQKGEAFECAGRVSEHFFLKAYDSCKKTCESLSFYIINHYQKG